VSVENGEWVMYGLDWDDPDRIKSPDELLDYINTVGFLPLFGNEVDGFSVEEHTAPGAWWTDDEDTDPWAWRILLARSGKVAYGKFFHKKAGFISLDWLPYFINYRRDGYDFDARWDDELATLRQKKLMDLFTEEDALFGYQMKRKAGFGKNGEKNFAGVVTDLQMMTYLCIKDMRCRVNKRGEEYGWPVSEYCTPEFLFGPDLVTSAYKEDPQESLQRILTHAKELYPDADEQDLLRNICG